MPRKLIASLAAVILLGAATASFAGDGYCSHGASASAAAWSGAWLQRSAGGAITVADVASHSAAAKAGLRPGDIVTAVNGHRLGDSGHCSEGACNVGSSVTYTVQRGASTRTIRVRLERMPQSASQRFANREAAYDRTLATLVLPAVD